MTLTDEVFGDERGEGWREGQEGVAAKRGLDVSPCLIIIAKVAPSSPDLSISLLRVAHELQIYIPSLVTVL